MTDGARLSRKSNGQDMEEQLLAILLGSCYREDVGD